MYLQNKIKSEVSTTVWVRPPDTRAVLMEKRQKKKSGESKTQCLECKSDLKVYTWVLATSCKRTEREDEGTNIN